MPTVTLRHDLVPSELSLARFFGLILEIVLTNSTIAHHEQARQLRANPKRETSSYFDLKKSEG
jgi:hypothetical protein